MKDDVPQLPNFGNRHNFYSRRLRKAGRQGVILVQPSKSMSHAEKVFRILLIVLPHHGFEEKIKMSGNFQVLHRLY